MKDTPPPPHAHRPNTTPGQQEHKACVGVGSTLSESVLRRLFDPVHYGNIQARKAALAASPHRQSPTAVAVRSDARALTSNP
ncbi:unnamed protein product [Arctogadus glacialis]